MKITLLTICVLICGQVSAQFDIEKSLVRTDSLNRLNFRSLKDEGKFDSNGLKAGLWTEYELFVDSAENIIPATIELGNGSFEVQFTKPADLQKKEGIYVSGQLDKKWKYFKSSYDENDKLVWEISKETEYSIGEKNGTEREYTGGTVYREAFYLSDQLNGTETFYWPGGEWVYLRAFWKNGGAQNAIWYFQNGTTKMTKDYEKFPLIIAEEFHENGKIKARYTMNDEELNGLYKFYDTNGKLIDKKYYKNGEESKK